MVGFTIVKRVWLHNRTFAPGQEKLLIKYGLDDEALHGQLRKGRIVLENIADEARLFDVGTRAAIKYATENEVDIFAIPFGTGTKGRITVSDVKKFYDDGE